MSMGPVVRGVCEILHTKYNLTSGEVNGACPECAASSFAGGPSASASSGYPRPWPRWQSGDPSCTCVSLPFLPPHLHPFHHIYQCLPSSCKTGRYLGHQSASVTVHASQVATSQHFEQVLFSSNPQGFDCLLSDPVGSLFKEEFMDHPDKW